MTELLQQVITEIQKLPAEQQDAIASRLLAELKGEHKPTSQPRRTAFGAMKKNWRNFRGFNYPSSFS